MEYLLEKDFGYGTSKHPNLYTWCLNEFSPDGVKQGPDYIPWRWSFSFLATRIDIRTDIQASDPGRPVKHDRRLECILRSGSSSGFQYVDRPVSFSMFGTDRPLTDFRLQIWRTDGVTRETCELSAWPAYKTLFDDVFEEEMPGSLTFSVNISPGRFDEIVEDLGRGPTSTIVFTPGAIEGIYAGWSPGVATNFAKVLCHEGSHATVKVPDGVKLSRTGAVAKFSLMISTSILT